MKPINMARKAANSQDQEPEGEPSTSRMRRRKTPKGAKSTAAAAATPVKTPAQRVQRKSCGR